MINATISHLRPIVAQLAELGLIEKAYIYGFDEFPRKFALPAIYALFGAIKREFPQLRTVATLASHYPGEYDSLPDDLPLDIWVQAYDWPWSLPHPHAMAPGFAKWKHSGATVAGHPDRDAWWYWASAPQSPTAINTFISRPALEARALFWLAAKHGIRGMLYYSIDQWAARCGLPSSVNKHPQPCRNLTRVNGTGMTDFANDPMDGDGSWVYPGPLGMISSNRLESITDGLEDADLFYRLGVNVSTFESNAHDLLEQLVPGPNGPNWNSSWARHIAMDPRAQIYTQLEAIRRQAAHRIMTYGEYSQRWG